MISHPRGSFGSMDGVPSWKRSSMAIITWLRWRCMDGQSGVFMTFLWIPYSQKKRKCNTQCYKEPKDRINSVVVASKMWISEGGGGNLEVTLLSCISSQSNFPRWSIIMEQLCDQVNWKIGDNYVSKAKKKKTLLLRRGNWNMTHWFATEREEMMVKITCEGGCNVI